MEWFNIKDKTPERGDAIIVECIDLDKEKKRMELIDPKYDKSVYLNSEYHIVEYFDNGYYCTFIENQEMDNLEDKYVLVKWCKFTFPKRGEIKSREKSTKFTRFEIMEI